MFMFSSVLIVPCVIYSKNYLLGMCDDLASPALNFCLRCEHCGPSWLLILYSSLGLEVMVKVEVLVDCRLPVLIV